MLLCFEQPHVFDGDDRLIRESRHQIDIALGKRLDAAARKADDADRLAVAHQRDAHHRAGAGADFGLLFFLVERVGPGIVDPAKPPADRGSADDGSGLGSDRRAPLNLDIGRLETSAGGEAPKPVFFKPGNDGSVGVQSLCRGVDGAFSIGCRSNLERLMTPSTSEVAVCCSSDWRSSVSSRVFSIAMTAWVAKFSNQFDLLLGKWAYLLPVNREQAYQFVVLKHRHDYKRPDTAKFDGGDG